jgi:hypothetical protein
MDIELFPCYSIPLRDFLLNKGLKYKLAALNPNNHKMFWLFIENEKLNNCLLEWKETKPQNV